MDSRSHILNMLRREQMPGTDLPSLDGPWLTFDRPADQFRQILEAVGGQTLAVPHEGDLPRALDQLPSFRAAQHVWSLVPAVASVGRDWTTVTDPHALEVLDYCVAPGEFGVAENAAVWVTQQMVPHRAALFITQHLVLVVPARDIVCNMHEAYARMGPGQVPFGTFISGPSKTADIEQSLVIGAHGARSLTVVLVGPEGH
jgi:L-lactate dehydrogenase complex protein LldG